MLRSFLFMLLFGHGKKQLHRRSSDDGNLHGRYQGGHREKAWRETCRCGHRRPPRRFLDRHGNFCARGQRTYCGQNQTTPRTRIIHPMQDALKIMQNQLLTETRKMIAGFDPLNLTCEQHTLLFMLAHECSAMLQEAHILNQQVADEEERQRGEALTHERQMARW